MRRGPTLIEALVIVAFVSIFVAVIVPAIRSVADPAKQRALAAPTWESDYPAWSREGETVRHFQGRIKGLEDGLKRLEAKIDRLTAATLKPEKEH
jgi:hypothetical protein